MNDPISTGKCAIIYFMDPPHLVSPAVPLLLSLRKHHPTAVIIPYVPKGGLSAIPERVRRFHDDFDAPIRELTRELEFSRKRYNKPYLHGNKILAVAERRDTEFCIFLDTDTYLAQPIDAEQLLHKDAVSVVPESVAGYARRFIEVWDATYAIFGMTTPTQRVKMLRTDREHPPYFNAGMVAFPEVSPSGERFGELWLDTAMKLDFHEAVDDEAKRPWLDQATLPVAIARSKARFNEKGAEFNYPVDGKDFPPHDGVRLYHYHGIERLQEANHTDELEQLLVESGLFNSLEHYLMPLTKKREDAAVFWRQISEEAEKRRTLKKQMNEADRSENASFKKLVQESKSREKSLRDQCSLIVEDVYYDDDWLKTSYKEKLKIANSR